MVGVLGRAVVHTGVPNGPSPPVGVNQCHQGIDKKRIWTVVGMRWAADITIDGDVSAVHPVDGLRRGDISVGDGLMLV